ncbi:hypothetical protein PAXRUDRAFT_20191 [Paxillus rubicundulus Ve08.2h10]|uniref:DDE-1 domain-containing protein n=1 Tax=Paxillus rubicundulus Ve08.2h10 TaxID=930991 RepID=A0A0D0DA92_9AGAM|nr:hypothetical protein PAXRUDRAFT_20191 [Paxillus rubicundulus Ve08.2h10]
MVADFVSTDYGWLWSPHGKESTRVLFQAGKSRDGYFTNEEILQHAEKVMEILQRHYAEEDHIFIFDNATTHLKRADDALSACQMPKSCWEWGVDSPERDDRGKPVIGPDGKIVLHKVHITNGFFNGAVQEFYWPEAHEDAGKFKGMARILEERGFNTKKLKAQCNRKFECPSGSTTCCLQHILYNQSNFVNVKSLLEQSCKCWGYVKRLYCCYPASSKDTDLEQNVVKALDSVPLESMRKFAMRSRQFMDAYHKGLDGKQAAWATKKYRGHRVLPTTLMEDLDKANLK